MTWRRTGRRLAGIAYQRAVRPFGLAALDRMLEAGLPAPLAEPVRYLLTDRTTPGVAGVSARIERRRAALAARTVVYRFVGAETTFGPARWPVIVTEPVDGPVVPARWLAEVASLTGRWGTFMHLCAAAFASRAILELGACVGISGAYLATSPACRRLVTIEGSPDLAATARETLAGFTDRAIVIAGPFDSNLSGALSVFEADGAGPDFVHIDGHHVGAATRHYVEVICSRLSRRAVVVLDDIYLYEDMWHAWIALSAARGFSSAVNVGRFGLLIWDGGPVTPTSWDLSPYLGRWRVGAARRSIAELARL